MHDFFDILGVAPDARGRVVQQACRQQVTAAHPDIQESLPAPPPPRLAPDLDDAAIQFVDMRPLIERMRQAFFRG